MESSVSPREFWRTSTNGISRSTSLSAGAGERRRESGVMLTTLTPPTASAPSAPRPTDEAQSDGTSALTSPGDSSQTGPR